MIKIIFLKILIVDKPPQSNRRHSHMKTETEATADNERIMPRFRALQREVTAASAEAVRLADAADAEACSCAAASGVCRELPRNVARVQ